MESQSIDDSLFIIHERLNPDVYAIGNWPPLSAEYVPQQGDNLNEIDQGPSQTVSGVSSESEDDSIQVLKVIRPQYVTRSQITGNVAGPNRLVRLRRRRIECALCEKTPSMLSVLNRTLGSAICGHLFCNRCMAFMFRNNWNICAICRIRLGKDDYHRVYW
ncbi:hypothetical protein JTE90_029120 [Oedothorax gibbosus]|uniref:RING-type domain-containing protein n=1 Tax=Oedothorax gibbosus TaxID=931172 RepID=A0AAV6TU96_9ARAC|nr:hypothetical protein JTE90_029120 [Oedothorax gibbosus]